MAVPSGTVVLDACAQPAGRGSSCAVGGGRPWLPYAATSNLWTAEMDPLECKSTSIGSASPEGLGMMGPKSSMTSMPSKVTFDWLLSSCSMRHCYIIPIKGSMPLLWLQHSTMSLCWWPCSTITDRQWLWYVRCCSIRANHLSQPWHLSFSMMTTILAWKEDSR
jgi:hypothetical protein